MNFDAKKHYKKIYFYYKNAFLDISRENNRRYIFIITIITKYIEIINNNKRYSNTLNFYNVKNRDK